METIQLILDDQEIAKLLSTLLGRANLATAWADWTDFLGWCKRNRLPK